MNNKLVVKPQTIIASSETKEKDILDYYGIPALLDRVVEKDKKNLKQGKRYLILQAKLQVQTHQILGLKEGKK